MCPSLQPQVYNSYSQAMIIPQSKVDLTHPVNEFAFKVKEFEHRREGMDITVRHLLQRQLPDWLRAKADSTTAAPALAAEAPAAAAAAASASSQPAANGGVQEPAAVKPQLVGSKRPSLSAEMAELAAAVAKRQQMAAEAVAAPASGGGGTTQPPFRASSPEPSDIQMADVEQQQAEGQEVDSVPIAAAAASAVLCC